MLGLVCFVVFGFDCLLLGLGFDLLIGFCCFVCCLIGLCECLVCLLFSGFVLLGDLLIGVSCLCLTVYLGCFVVAWIGY